MFFSVNSPRFREKHPYLERFVLDKHLKYLPPEYKFYVGYLRADRARSAGVTGSLAGTQLRVYSEISFTPFSYILSLDSPPPEHEMLDISFFARYGYDEFASLHLPLPSVSLYTPFPGDFREREKVLRESHPSGL
jgi:hypothetical protein